MMPLIEWPKNRGNVWGNGAGMMGGMMPQTGAVSKFGAAAGTDPHGSHLGIVTGWKLRGRLMNWKTRQLFSDREHGIVSGLSPVNMMGGGSVPMPGYKIGGTVPKEPSIEQQAAAMAGGPLKKGEQPFDAGITQEELDLHTTYYDVSQDTAALEEFEALSIEQRVAELAAQQGISVPAARAMILKQMIQEKGLTLSDEIINQFATGLITLHDALAQAVGPPKMQTGGLALDLFEEGDQEINEPLNMMAQATLILVVV